MKVSKVLDWAIAYLESGGEPCYVLYYQWRPGGSPSMAREIFTNEADARTRVAEIKRTRIGATVASSEDAE